MKFIISFLISSSVLASPIMIFHESNEREAMLYKGILNQSYFIPEELMTVETVKTCSEAKGLGKLDLCIKNNGDLLMVSVDTNFVNESIKVFKAL